MRRFSVRAHSRGVLRVCGTLLFVLALGFGGLFYLRSTAATRATAGLLEGTLADSLGLQVELGGVEADGWDRASARSATVIVDLPQDSPLKALDPAATALKLYFERVDVGFQPLNLLRVAKAPATIDGTIHLYGGRAGLIVREGGGARRPDRSAPPDVWLLTEVEAVLRLDVQEGRLLVKSLRGKFLGAPIRLEGEGTIQLTAPHRIDLALQLSPVRTQRLWDALHPQTLTSPPRHAKPLTVLRFSPSVGPARIIEGRLRIRAPRPLPRLSAATERTGMFVQADDSPSDSRGGRPEPLPEREARRGIGLPGLLAGEVRLSGPLEAPRVRFDLGWVARPGPGSIRVRGSVASSDGVEIELSGDDVALADWAAFVPGLPTLPGVVDFSGEVSGSVKRTGFSPTFSLDAFLRTTGTEKGEADTPRAASKGAAPDAIALRMQGAPDGINGAIRIPEGTLQPIASAVPGLELLQGSGALTFRIGGSPAEPRLWGEGSLDGLTLRHPYLSEGITGLDVHVKLAGDRITVDSSGGRSGGGGVELSGEIRDFRTGRSRLALRLRVDGLRVRTPDFRARVRGMLDLRGPVSDPTIRGGLVLSDALLQFGEPLPTPRPPAKDDVRAAAAGGGVASPTVSTPASSDPASGSGVDPGVGMEGAGDATGTWDPKLDVALTAGEDVRIRYPAIGLDVRATGTLHVGGRLSDPRLSGVAEGTRGRLQYLGIRFNLTRGEARFAEYRGLSPVLDVVGDTHIEGAAVLLRLQGELDQLRVELSSEPPMPESEILARLGYLEGVADGFDSRLGWGGESLVGPLWEGVRAYLASGLERAAATLLSVDEFRLSGNLLNPAVHVGKYVGRRMYATYTLPVDRRSEARLGLEWRPEPELRFGLSVTGSGLVEMGTEVRIRF